MKHSENFTLDMPFEEAIERFSRVNTKELEPDIICGASPFVKWAGGKRGIIDELVKLLPPEIETYYEPFAGGAALFFEIYEQLEKAYISDSNLELMLTFQTIKKEPKALIERLEQHAQKDSEEYYYKVRAQYNLQNALDIAARFIYLNKTCYNGLYRVNSKGEFNVPRGRYANPDIVQRKNIMACNSALRKATIEYREFDTIKPNQGDFVYCDPPYHPAEAKAFTKYTKLDFSEKDQERLRDFALALSRAGVRVMLSNSDTPFIRSLYSNAVWNIITVQAPRLVNCKSEGRVAVNELVIRNYQ
jgi:DNA adenine methylase